MKPTYAKFSPIQPARPAETWASASQNRAPKVVYGVYTMKRKQIYLAEEQERAIKRLARERGVAEAVIIREAMDAYLAEERAAYDADDEDEGICNTDKDPILKMIGMIKNGPGDGSKNYKRDLYGGERGPL